MMIAFENNGYFDHASWVKAAGGIIHPLRHTIAADTILYRFGDTAALASTGCWWLEESQVQRIEGWASLKGLTLPHAARVMAAIAHKYSGMRVLARARVRTPLLAWIGHSKDQTVSGPHGDERLSPEASVTGPLIDQLYIPGLDKPTVVHRALTMHAPRSFTASDSEIGGVVGIPPGAIRH